MRVGRRRRLRRRDKMFSAEYVANDITFLQNFFSDVILSLRIVIGASGLMGFGAKPKYSHISDCMLHCDGVTWASVLKRTVDCYLTQM